jgi:hypothetical protein
MSEYRRVSHSTATFGDMSRATQLPPPIGDPDTDLISRTQEQQRQALRERDKVNDHRRKWEGIEIRRDNIIALVDILAKDQQALFDAEQEDAALASEGDSFRSETRIEKRGYGTERGKKRLYEERMLVENLFVIKKDDNE